MSNKQLEIEAVIQRWQKESLSKERFEYPDQAVRILTQAAESGIPAPLVSPICANYETYQIDGVRRPTVHNEMVWDSSGYGLRRGYVLLHEELPSRLLDLNLLGIPFNLGIVLVDVGMSEQLFSPLNLDHRGRSAEELKEHIRLTTCRNVETITNLLSHGLSQRSFNGDIPMSTKVVKLTDIVAHPESKVQVDGFYHHWDWWNSQLRGIMAEGDNRWAGLLRTTVEADGSWLQYAWGGYTTREEIIQRVVDENFGLVAATGDHLQDFSNTLFGTKLTHKGDVVMLDTIPGPLNPGHKEFYAYNLDYPDGGSRPRTSILRPFHNLVLLSDGAVKVPYLGKSLETIADEASEYGL